LVAGHISPAQPSRPPFKTAQAPEQVGMFCDLWFLKEELPFGDPSAHDEFDIYELLA